MPFYILQKILQNFQIMIIYNYIGGTMKESDVNEIKVRNNDNCNVTKETQNINELKKINELKYFSEQKKVKEFSSIKEKKEITPTKPKRLNPLVTSLILIVVAIVAPSYISSTKKYIEMCEYSVMENEIFYYVSFTEDALNKTFYVSVYNDFMEDTQEIECNEENWGMEYVVEHLKPNMYYTFSITYQNITIFKKVLKTGEYQYERYEEDQQDYYDKDYSSGENW